MSIIICLMSLIKTSFCSLSVISQPGEMAVICFISWGAALFSVWTFQQYLWKSCTLLNSLFFPPHHLPQNGQRCWSHLGGFGTFHSRKIQNFHSFLHLMPRSLSPITKLWLLFLILSGRQWDSNKPLLFSCSSLGSVYHFRKSRISGEEWFPCQNDISLLKGAGAAAELALGGFHNLFDRIIFFSWWRTQQKIFSE